MKKFVFWWTDDLREKTTKHMRESGHLSISTFIRMLLIKYPGTDRKWTDDDMKAFARDFAERPANRPEILQTPESQINEAFEKFKAKKT